MTSDEVRRKQEICSSSSTSPGDSETEEVRRLEHASPFSSNQKTFSKQLSMRETPRDRAWEKRRRQILWQERMKDSSSVSDNIDQDHLTDEDFNELKGCIELGFGFNEQQGQKLCNTLPALDLYFAVNRQYYATSPVSSPGSRGSLGSVDGASATTPFGGQSPFFGSDSDSWKICSPGDDPQQVKTKLRHWAQAVACSVMQSY